MASSERISRWYAAGSPKRKYTLPRGTVTVAVACRDTVELFGELTQICWPDATTLFSLIGWVPALSAYIRPLPSALTVACPVVDVTVNGPTGDPAGPLNEAGVTVSPGGSGAGTGPRSRNVVHDLCDGVVQPISAGQHIAIAEIPDRGLDGGRPVSLGESRRLRRIVGVILVQNASNEADAWHRGPSHVPSWYSMPTYVLVRISMQYSVSVWLSSCGCP